MRNCAAMSSAEDNRFPTREAAAQGAADALFAAKSFPGKATESWRYARAFSALSSDYLAPARGFTEIVKNDCAAYDAAFMPEEASEKFAPLFISQDDGALFPLTQENAFFMAGDNARPLAFIAGAGKRCTLEIAHHIEAAGASRHRIYIIVEKNAALTLKETYQAPRTDGRALAASLVHIVLEEGASCDHYLLCGIEGENAALLRSDVIVGKGADYRAFSLHAGGKASKYDAAVRLEGEGARIDRHVIAAAGEGEYRDAYLPVLHNAPRASGAQTVKQVSDKDGACVYYGAVDVPAHAGGAKATQLNRNILLHKKAKAYGRPELHILTDDVMCSHGSTTGQCDPLALYYLESRGIPHGEALALLLDGFLTPDAAAAPDDAVRAQATNILREWAKGRR